MTLRCGICGQEFEDEAALEAHAHETAASEDAALICPVCGETFSREEDLIRHQGDDHIGLDLPDEEQAVP